MQVAAVLRDGISRSTRITWVHGSSGRGFITTLESIEPETENETGLPVHRNPALNKTLRQSSVQTRAGNLTFSVR